MFPLAFKILFGVWIAIDLSDFFVKQGIQKQLRYLKLACWLVFFILLVAYK